MNQFTYIYYEPKKCFMRNVLYSSEVEEVLLVVTSIKHCYLRQGKWPESGYSKNHLLGENERGISVWRAYLLNTENVDLVIPIIANLQGSLVDFIYGLGKESFVVDGEIIGEGSNGEPLLKDVVWIDSVRVQKINIHNGELIELIREYKRI